MIGDAIAATDTTELATRNGLAALRTELKGEIAGVRGELKGEIAALGDKLTWRLFYAGMVIVGLDVTLMKLLP